MALYDYQNATAFDPYTREGVNNATGEVYDLGDTGFTQPLTVTLMVSGLQTVSLESDKYSQLPGFQVDDRKQVVFKSGDFTKVLNTTTPLVGPAGPAVSEAVDNGDNTVTFLLEDGTPAATVALPASEVPGPEGPVGPRGLPGPDAIPADEAVAAYATTPGSATAAALSSTIAHDGVPKVMKPADNTKSGVMDWEFQSATGYLAHWRAGEGSGASSAAFGIGTDKGSGSAGLMALKNDGHGLQIGSHASHTGKAFTLSSYGKAATPAEISLYAGAKPLMITNKTGAGFPDGSTTNGSTTLTSATANFTAADVGATLTQTTSRGEGFGAIPTGATIVSVTNSTTVVMSAPSTRTAAGINFLVGGRAPASNQAWLSLYQSTDEIIKLAPAVSTVNSKLEVNAAPGTAVNGSILNGASLRLYTAYNGQHVAHEVYSDAFALRLRHYQQAAKGTEATPVESFKATNSGGSARIGFYGATAVAKPTVTGSRTDGTALASLITALASLGLITDSTTA